MSESTESKADLPLEISLPDGAVPLESILCTEELQRRPSRPPDYEKENRALLALMSALDDSPRTILQTLAETIMEVTQSDSAGLSLLTKEDGGKRFYWPAIAGIWKPHIGGGTPRNFGPCGDVLDRNVPLLFRHFERRYPYLLPVVPAGEECLLVPFYVEGKAVGTVWAIMHGDVRRFDAEDERMMRSLGKFASSGYRTVESTHELTLQVAARERAEAGLRELASGLEVRMRRLVDANVIGIFIWNLEGQIVEANEAFLHMVQYSPEDLALGRVRWRDLTPAEWHDRDDRAEADLIATGTARPYEKEFFRKDGSRVPALVGGALFEKEGRDGVAFVLDLSAQKHAERALRDSAVWTRAIMETSFDCVITADHQGRIVEFNQAAERTFGYSRSEVLGKGLAETIIPPGLREAHHRGMRRYLETQDAHVLGRRVEMTGMRADGSEFPIELSISRVALEGPPTFTGYVRDISERKRAEEALRRSEDRLRLIIDTIPIMAWSVRPDGIVDFLNQRWMDYSGLSLEQYVQEPTRLIHSDDIPRVVEERLAGMATGEPYEHEMRLRRADGEYRWFLVRTVPLRDQRGNIVKWYGSSVDVEDRKRAEDGLRAAMNERTRLSAVRAEIAMALARRGSLREVLRACAEALVEHLDAAFARIWTLSNDGTELELQASAGMYTRLSGRYSRIPLGKFKIGHIAEARKAHLSNDLQNDPKINDKDWARAEKITSFAGYPLVVEGRTVGVMGMFSQKPIPESTLDTLSFLCDGIAQGIERKRAEEALRRSEAYLAEAQKLTHTGAWAFSPSNPERSYWTAEYYRIYGFEPATDEARRSAIVERIHPDDRARVNRAFEEAIHHKMDFEHDLRIILPEGAEKHLHTVVHPVVGQDGEVAEFVGTSVDVTEHFQSRAALERAFEEIRELKDQLYRENLALRDEVDRTSMFEEIVGASTALQHVLSRISKVAPTDSTVFITGETGTGKELVARAIHKRSQRSGRAFVSVNCAAMAPSLISSELFGHEKGAFTGATQRRLGRFELADGGTIFLDEVGELPRDTQVALLRVLQEREFERVGGGRPIQVDVRVIAATNRDLKAAAAGGAFRPDLFYRLNVFPIEVPPLRERKDDILMLVEYFVKRYASRTGKNIRTIDKKTLELLQSYEWPGNIRELQNVIERSVIVSSGDVFSVDESWLSTESPRPAAPIQSWQPLKGETRSEREIIEAALTGSKGRVSGPSGAATKLGIPPSTLESRIKALKIRKSQFKFG